jgi:hypothetical protein
MPAHLATKPHYLQEICKNRFSEGSGWRKSLEVRWVDTLVPGSDIVRAS